MKLRSIVLTILMSTSLFAQCLGDLNEDNIKNILDIVLLVNDILDGNDQCEEDLFGCLDPAACNFNPFASYSDDSCTYAQDYYDCENNCIHDNDDDGICDELEVIGCTDDTACNFNPNATDEGECEYSTEFSDCYGNFSDCAGESYIEIINELGDAQVHVSENCYQYIIFGEAYNQFSNFGIAPDNYILIGDLYNTNTFSGDGEGQFFINSIDDNGAFAKVYVLSEYSLGDFDCPNEDYEIVLNQATVNMWEVANVVDVCGVCGGENASCTDCNGELNGNAYEDECGTCDADPYNDGYTDNCGVCDLDDANDCIQDCNNEWGGTAQYDDCGLCTGGSTGYEYNEFLDCNEQCFGAAIIDDCGICDGNNADMDECGICNGGGLPCVVTDFDGNSYATVQIGDQVWMTENLKTTHYNNGDEIPTNLSYSDWQNTTSGAVSVYDDEESNAHTYGRLYNWYAVDDGRGVCPENFHVPTDDEYKELEMFLGMSESEANSSGWRGTNEGSKLADRADLWNNGNLENNSEFGASGFSAFPGGYRYFSGAYYSMGNAGYFWSSSESSSNYGWNRLLSYYSSDVARPNYGKQYGFSVRCVGDQFC